MFHPNGLQKLNNFQRKLKMETKIKIGVKKCWFNEC